MGHPSTENLTPFTFEPLFLTDEALRPLFVPVLKATFDLRPRGAPALSAEQAPLLTGGERWEGGGDAASLRLEPEGAFFKAATDVVLVGHAHAPAAGTRELLAELHVGPVHKQVRVLGDRTWFKSMGGIGVTQPLPFERIPLRYERAFGGKDGSAFEPRNPLGTGFREKGSRFEENLRLPNLESPAEPLRSWGQRPPPTGFGFIEPHWQPRAGYAGTYDDAWKKSRSPLLPKDFDRRFLNGAPRDQLVPGYLRGGEAVLLKHVAPGAPLTFRLPALPSPEVLAPRARGLDDLEGALRLDTVVLDTDAMKLFLVWRGTFALQREPTELRSIQVTCEGAETLEPGQPVGTD
ncbi:DUF2169 domain-containing protein [Myxococcus sp. AB036A]|uniref:DUF2169 family type VI secretion system accessory protein n=1 Tax=Myxococcus sp. AB036A TaxID=2562793 RepID=UPI0011463FE0|nr:DUF2169 domain-containing protein [Myxococcus sp. AB036A]